MWAFFSVVMYRVPTFALSVGDPPEPGAADSDVAIDVSQGGHNSSSSVRASHSTLESTQDQRVVSEPALGRSFGLGSLYDARSGTTISGFLWILQYLKKTRSASTRLQL